MKTYSIRIRRPLEGMKNMHKLTFSSIENHSFIVEENDFFTIYMNSSFNEYYDLNYLKLKYSPTLLEYKMIEEILDNERFKQKQSHLNIIWPDDIGIMPEVLEYLSENQYKLGKQELMILTPNNSKIQKPKNNYQFYIVNEDNFESFFKLNYKEDLQYGEKFAELKKEFYSNLMFHSDKILLIAKRNNQTVGSLIIILSDDFVEIDHVLTDSVFRNQGVATAMLDFVVKTFNKTIILVVDAEDTPKEMYSKFGFESISSQISGLKTNLN